MKEFRTTHKAWDALQSALSAHDADVAGWLDGKTHKRPTAVVFELGLEDGKERLLQLAAALVNHGVPGRTGGFLNKVRSTCEECAGVNGQVPAQTPPEPAPAPEPTPPVAEVPPAPEPPKEPEAAPEPEKVAAPQPEPEKAPEPTAPEPEPRFTHWRAAFAELAREADALSKKAQRYAEGAGE